MVCIACILRDTDSAAILVFLSETKVYGSTLNTFSFDERPVVIEHFHQPVKTDIDYLSTFIMVNLKENGFCVLDGYVPENMCKNVLSEAKNLNHTGKMTPGRTSGVDTEKAVNKSVRSDRIIWIEDDGVETHWIYSYMTQVLDPLVESLNVHLAENTNLKGRTKVNPCNHERFLNISRY